MACVILYQYICNLLTAGLSTTQKLPPEFQGSRKLQADCVSAGLYYFSWKYVWQYVEIKHSITWNDKGLKVIIWKTLISINVC